MQSRRKQNFFTKNGKTIKGLISDTFFLKETVDTLIDPSWKEPTFKDVAKRKFLKIKRNAVAFFNTNELKLKKYWVTGSFALFSAFAAITVFYPMQISPDIKHKYSIYASTPLQLGSTEYKVYSRDARSQKINQVFREFNCPLEGMGEVFVYEADNYNIPWWLVAAIAFKESSCGKMTPEPGGLESYNAWGWGVYGDKIQSFDNWARGIETVSEYLGEKFYSKGITEPCDIMKTYTPPSNGSWCKDVKYFGDLIQNYKSQ